jgi:hypothetical protein
MALPTAPATAQPGLQGGNPPSSATAWWRQCCSSPWSSREQAHCSPRAIKNSHSAEVSCAVPACTPTKCTACTVQPSPAQHLLLLLPPPVALPACSGMWMAHTYEEHKASYWRPHGLLNPPDNPFLREDLRPRVYSHRRKRELQEQQQQQAAAPAMLPAAAAVAAAAAATPAAAGAQRASG